MNTPITPVKFVYTSDNVVYQKLNNDEFDTNKSEIWYPINFYWKPIVELKDDMINEPFLSK